MKNRRTFLKKSGLLILATALPFPSVMLPKNKKLGVALVGLGSYSTYQLAPALRETGYCELRGIVTGSPEKIPRWQEKYGIKDKNIYNYDNLHQIANNAEIDVVYIVLPNALHAKYSIIAANAGKHVWCEKPMATTAAECRKMIEACQKNKVKLAIGYRLQHETNNRQLMKWSESQPFGPITNFEASAGFHGNSLGWRLDKSLGGGAMYDMGVYPLNAARYTIGKEPLAVSARHETTRPQMFAEVDETTYFQLDFPAGIKADCATSFGKNINNLEVTCENGWYYLRPFQSYSSVKGKASNGIVLRASKKNQQAVQMDDDALAIIKDKPLIAPGEEGLKDILILEKIYESAAKGGEKILI